MSHSPLDGVGARLIRRYSVSSTLLIGFALGKALGLSEALVTLIATGSAICGCSAVAATQPIINAEAHEVAAAVGVVVLCGTAAMVRPLTSLDLPSSHRRCHARR